METDRLPTVAFFGGGDTGLSCLKHLHALHLSDRCRIAGVHPSNIFESDEKPTETFARDNAIAIFPEPEEVLGIDPLDLIFSIGNYFLFTTPYIEKPMHGIINFHAAPLPIYRGSAVSAHAILNGDTEFAATFHKAVEALDAGPIVHEDRFPIEADMTAQDVDRKAVEAGLSAFVEKAEDFIHGRFIETPQRGPGKTYKRSDMEEFRKIDPNWDPARIWDHVRACDWEGVIKPAFMKIGQRKVYLTTTIRGSYAGIAEDKLNR